MNQHEYNQIDAVNWSSLKHMRDSALAYRHHLDTPRADTASLAFGRLVHTLVFEPAKFQAEYVIWDQGDQRGKAWQEFKEANAGKTIFKPDEIDSAVSMSEAVRSHPLVLPYLGAAGAFEQAIVWTDSETGIRCKARPDWLIPDARLLIDLKTTVTIDGRRFGSAAARYGYHCQLAHYSNGIRAALGWEPFRRLVVAVEKAAPYDVAVFELDPEALFAAEEEVRELLKRLHICRLTNHWPGRYTEEQALQLPAWVTMDDDASAEALGLDMED